MNNRAEQRSRQRSTDLKFQLDSQLWTSVYRAKSQLDERLVLLSKQGSRQCSAPVAQPGGLADREPHSRRRVREQDEAIRLSLGMSLKWSIARKDPREFITFRPTIVQKRLSQ